MKYACCVPPFVRRGIVCTPFWLRRGRTFETCCKSNARQMSARQNNGSPLSATEVRICPNLAFSKILIAFIEVLLWKITGNEETASPFPLQYTSKAGFPLQISTGVRCRYVFPMRYKNTANGYCLRLSTAFEYEVHRKSTTNPRTMQIIREKNAKSLKFIPILGAREIYFPFPYIWNEMKYIGILYIYISFMSCKSNAFA